MCLLILVYAKGTCKAGSSIIKLHGTSETMRRVLLCLPTRWVLFIASISRGSHYDAEAVKASQRWANLQLQFIVTYLLVTCTVM